MLARGAIAAVLATVAFASHGNHGQERESPVAKVILLLQDMLSTFEEEQRVDEEIYDEMVVWCETGEAEKTQAIANGQAKITTLNSEIEADTALSARLSAEMGNLEKELKANEGALAEATALRKEQNDEFNAQQKDLVESVTALKAAVLVLSKHHESLLQLPRSPQQQSVASTLQRELTHHAARLKGRLTPSQRRAAEAFVQVHLGQEPGYLSATPAFKGAYGPQSGEIFGILQQMLSDFEGDLADAQQEESGSQRDYTSLKAAKSQEIRTGQQQLETKTKERADAAERLVRGKVDLKDSKVALMDDENYLMDLKEECQATDTEWHLRQGRRHEEIAAVTKALELLESDEAQGVFDRTWQPPSFFQLRVTASSAGRAEASTVLARVAAKLSSPRLSALATKVKLDTFTEVKKAIDDMVSALLKEKDDEIKKRDFCIGELHGTDGLTAQKGREKEDATAKIDALNATIGQLNSEIKMLKVEIEGMNAELTAAGEERKSQNHEFQLTVADQQSTQQILLNAKEYLLGYYGKKAAAAASLAQRKKQEPPKPNSLDVYENSESAPTVIGMIEKIMNEAKQLELDATRDEEEAQAEYERFVKDSDTSIFDKNKAIAHKSVHKADAEKKKQQAESDRDYIDQELGRLSSYATDMNLDCEFTLKNFEVRQTARDEEVQALREATSILSGSSS